MSLGRDPVAMALPAYEVGKELGRGSFGIVWAGQHRHVGRQVAIKQMAAPDAEVRARFLAEAKVLASLEHPHIVPLYDYVEAGDQCLLVMERLEGGTLTERFGLPQKVDIASACAVAMVTCAALHHAHQRGVLHRDVKPDNLMFTRDGHLKVTDFGIAKVMTEGGGRSTAYGAFKGTPAYMAPEQVLGDPPGPGVDIYATGLLLYELLSAQLPFSDDGQPVAVALRRIHEDPRPLEDAAPELRGPLANVTMQALNRLPGDRFPTAEEFGVAIGRAATTMLGPGWLDRSQVTPLAAGPIFDAAHIAGGTRRPEARATIVVPDDGATEAFPSGGVTTPTEPMPAAALTPETPVMPIAAVAAATSPLSPPAEPPPSPPDSPGPAPTPPGNSPAAVPAPAGLGPQAAPWPAAAPPVQYPQAAPSPAPVQYPDAAPWPAAAPPAPGIPQPPASAPPAQAPPAPRSRWRTWAVLAAMAALLLAAVAYIAGRGHQDNAAPPATTSAVGTTTLPATTTAPATTSATNLFPTPPAMVAPVRLVQQWVSALVAQDWATARRIAPAMGSTSDADLAAGYGGLRAATIVYLDGAPASFNVASVAHEDVGAGPRTSVYCFTISADLSAGTITTQSGRRAGSPAQGWVGPESVPSAINSCR